MNRMRLVGLLGLLVLGGCERGMHDMYQQPKDKAASPASLFADDNSARPPVPGSMPMAAGAAADTSSGRLGRVSPVAAAGPALPLGAHGEEIAKGGADARRYASPVPLTESLLQRGRERFDIYCAPCHGRSGDGQGMVVQRGFPAPPSFHTDKLREAPDSHFYQVITHGYGVMYPYADRVAPADRWAIVAYVRALQLSQHAPRDELQMQDIRQLDAAGATPAATP